MDATHARPMTAYAALCAAAAVVLAQSVAPSSTVVDSVARAGDPAPLIGVTRLVTLLSDQATDVSVAVSDTLTDTVAPLVVAATQAPAAVVAGHRKLAVVERSTGGGAPGGATAPAKQPTIAPQPTVEPAPSGVQSPTDRFRARVDRKADRGRASEHRKADRASAREQRQADRARDKAQRANRR